MKKIHVLAGLIVLALLIVIAAYVITIFIPMILFMYDPPETKSNSILHYITAVNGSEPYRAMQQAENSSFSFMTNVEPTDDCLMMVLVDYRAVPFYFNGTYTQTHLFWNSSGKEGHYSGTVQVPNLSDGFHDLTLVYFVPPANFSYNRWGMPTNSMLTFASRYNIVSGNATRPEPGFNNNYSDTGIAYSGDYLHPQGGPDLAKKPFEPRWSREHVKRGDIIDYYVILPNPTNVLEPKRNATFALVPLLDYEPIPVRYDEPGYTYYGTVVENQTASVHMSFKVPDVAGPHRLAVIVATYPFEDIETAPDVRNRDAPAITWVKYVDLFVA